jgi:hypothetical protein
MDASPILIAHGHVYVTLGTVGMQAFALNPNSHSVVGITTITSKAYHGGDPTLGGVAVVVSLQANRRVTGNIDDLRGAARITKLGSTERVQVDRVAISTDGRLTAANAAPANSGSASTTISYTTWVPTAPAPCMTYRVRATYSVRWADQSISHLDYLGPPTRVCV